MSNGVGTSKEDKRRKRRSLPYEKKPQADKARLKKSLKSRIAAINRSVGSSKYIAKELKELGLTASKIKEIKERLKDENFFGIDIKKLKKGIIKFPSKKGKPHLKKGGKAK